MIVNMTASEIEIHTHLNESFHYKIEMLVIIIEHVCLAQTLEVFHVVRAT